MIKSEPKYENLLNQKIEMVTKIHPDSKSSMHLYYDESMKTSEGSEILAYPSVTSVLDIVSYNKHLMGWANSLGFRRIKYEEELARLAQVGIYMHALAQQLVDTDAGTEPVFIKDPLTEYYVRKRIQGLQYRLRNETYETIATEAKVISHTHKIAGTIDWLSLFGNHITVSDFKSSRQMKEKFLLQLGGYFIILRDDYGIIPERGQILLCKEDRTTIHEFDQDILEEAGNAFLMILAYYNAHEKLITHITKEAVLKETVTGQ